MSHTPEHDTAEQLAQRVAVLEAAVAALKSQIKEAAHELRDDHAFMRPYGEALAGHVADHWMSNAGRSVIKWLAAIGVGVLLFLAGRWGVLK